MAFYKRALKAEYYYNVYIQYENYEKECPQIFQNILFLGSGCMVLTIIGATTFYLSSLNTLVPK